MSIGNFVSAGIVLNRQGKQDVALSLICSAVDATAKKEFSVENNNKRNKRFVSKYFPIITLFGFPGIIAGGIKKRKFISCVARR